MGKYVRERRGRSTDRTAGSRVEMSEKSGRHHHIGLRAYYSMVAVDGSWWSAYLAAGVFAPSHLFTALARLLECRRPGSTRLDSTLCVIKPRLN